MKIPNASLIALLALGLSASAALQAQNAPALLAPPVAALDGSAAVPVLPHPDQSVLLRNDDARLAANKRRVYDLWREVANAGRVEALDDYLSPDFRQYSPAIPAGIEGFKQWFAERAERRDKVPDEITDPVVTLVAEGNDVVLALVNHYPEPDGSGEYSSTRFHLFRFEGEEIVAHWDSSRLPSHMPLPGASADAPLPIEGEVGDQQLPLLLSEDANLAINKRLVFDMWRHIPEAGREELAALYMDPIYIQHNPNAVTGRDGVVEYFAQRPDSAIDSWLEDPLVALVAEENLVVQVLQEERFHPDTGASHQVAWFDMFRVQNGRLAEHWDTATKGELPAVMQEGQEEKR